MATMHLKRDGTGPRVNGRAFATVFAMVLCCGVSYALGSQVSPATARPATPHVPPYHAHPPRAHLPQVLPWMEFAGNPCAENAYYFAAKIRPVLYQQPCYCPCGEELGHTCLLDCFTRSDKHAAICATCLKEAIFAYRQTLLGVNAQSIRAKIIKGEWQKIDLAKYTQPPKQ
jgi:Protein of unknown function with PCYCGC motif